VPVSLGLHSSKSRALHASRRSLMASIILEYWTRRRVRQDAAFMVGPTEPTNSKLGNARHNSTSHSHSSKRSSNNTTTGQRRAGHTVASKNSTSSGNNAVGQSIEKQTDAAFTTHQEVNGMGQNGLDADDGEEDEPSCCRQTGAHTSHRDIIILRDICYMPASTHIASSSSPSSSSSPHAVVGEHIPRSNDDDSSSSVIHYDVKHFECHPRQKLDVYFSPSALRSYARRVRRERLQEQEGCGQGRVGNVREDAAPNRAIHALSQTEGTAVTASPASSLSTASVASAPSSVSHSTSSATSTRIPIPIVLHVHGGGWQRGDRSSEWRGSPNAARSVARHGMIGVVISYRLAAPAWFGRIVRAMIGAGILFGLLALIGLGVTFPQPWLSLNGAARWGILIGLLLLIDIFYISFLAHTGRHPHGALDVARAMKFVVDEFRDGGRLAKMVEERLQLDHPNHAESSSCQRSDHDQRLQPYPDPSTIFLSGHSAGAHLAALVTCDKRYIRTVAGSASATEDIMSRVKGVLCVSGLYDLRNPLGIDPSSIRNRFFRASYGAAAFGSSMDSLLDASPIHWTHASLPPFLLLSASSDYGLEVDAQRFRQHLESLGVPVEVHVVPHTSHASIASNFERHEAHKHAFRFVQRCCRKGGWNQDQREARAQKKQQERDRAHEREKTNSNQTKFTEN